MGRFTQPDFSRGDPNTLGGYAAVHDRPAAFEGSDGYSYSVEVLVDRDDDDEQPYGAYLFFVKWARIGASSPESHLESDVLVRAASESDARARAGEMKLNDVKKVLDALIERAHGGTPKRKWWDAMADEGDGGGE